MGLAPYRLAKDIGVPPRRINEIVNGQHALRQARQRFVLRPLRSHAESSGRMEFAPTGQRLSAQGWSEATTLGLRIKMPINPNGVAARSGTRRAATPLGL